ncbi:MAG: hypothetical protein U7123_23935 [Potamolinea sp.]
MLNPSKNHPKQPLQLQSLKQLIHSHPYFFLGGLWVTLVLVGGVASFGLFNVGKVEQEGSKPTPTIETIQESTAKSTDKKDLPLSLFAAVAIGCAAGSLLVTKALKDSSQGRSTPKRLKQVVGVSKKRRHPPRKSPPVPEKPQPVSSALTWQTIDNKSPTIEVKLRPTTNRAALLTRVTVLPPEENHPLDGKQENLAEMMDLRKHYTLASLMRSN